MWTIFRCLITPCFFIFDRGPALFFLEIVHEIFFYCNDPPYSDLRKAVVGYKRKYMCTEYWLPLSLSLPRKSVVRLFDHFDMIIAVDWDVKPQTKQKTKHRRQIWEKLKLQNKPNYNALSLSNCLGAKFHCLPLQGQGWCSGQRQLSRPQADWAGHEDPREDCWWSHKRGGVYWRLPVWLCPRKRHYRCDLSGPADTGEIPSSEQEALYGLRRR